MATIPAAVDGGLTFDSLSGRLFVGTANGANSGRVYTIDVPSRSVELFATGFDGCLGIHRAAASGDLFFLEAHSLFKLASTNVVFAPRVFIWTAVELGWLSETGKVYQVQWATEVDTNTWMDFGLPVPGTGGTNFMFDTTRDHTKKFYRVKQSQ